MTTKTASNENTEITIGWRNWSFSLPCRCYQYWGSIDLSLSSLQWWNTELLQSICNLILVQQWNLCPRDNKTHACADPRDRGKCPRNKGWAGVCYQSTNKDCDIIICWIHTNAVPVQGFWTNLKLFQIFRQASHHHFNKEVPPAVIFTVIFLDPLFTDTIFLYSIHSKWIALMNYMGV